MCLLWATEVVTAVRSQGEHLHRQVEPGLPGCPAISPHLCLDGGTALGELTPDSCWGLLSLGFFHSITHFCETFPPTFQKKKKKATLYWNLLFGATWCLNDQPEEGPVPAEERARGFGVRAEIIAWCGKLELQLCCGLQVGKCAQNKKSQSS